jgi:hypothetical protein
MTTVHPTRTLYDEITTRIATQTSRPCGDAVRPPGANPPYSVLYPREDVVSEGSLGDPNEVRVMQFQVTCVGRTMDEAQHLQFGVQTALLGWAPTVGDPVLLEFGSGVFRDDDGEQPVFFTTDRFRTFVG